MGFLSRFEGKMEDTLEGAADRMANSPISPVQIAKKAEKQMRREKMVGAGKQYAPTLFTVLVNPDDDHRLFGYYPTLAGETETYLRAKAAEQGLVMDGQPLVRFIVDDSLKHGKFDVIAEAVAAPIIVQLREEEMHRYGLAARPAGYQQGNPGPVEQPYPHQGYNNAPYQAGFTPYQGAPAPSTPPAHGGWDAHNQNQLPYVPENELDRSVDYGEYTFDSHDFVDPHPPAGHPQGGFGGAVARDVVPAAAAGVAGGALAGIEYAPAPHGSMAAGYQQPGTATPGRPAETIVFAGGVAQDSPLSSPPLVRARLVDQNTNRTYDLTGTRLTIGRESKNNISLPDINASRTHAELCQNAQGTWVITDLGSTNGTFVNGRAVASAALTPGDRITVGLTNLMFTQA